MELDETFMREALRLAMKARAADEVPVGAVVVREGKIISRAYNQVELLKDATAHAEMLALTAAEAGFGDWRDRKSTRLNSSHGSISYAVFCLKKKKKQ